MPYHRGPHREDSGLVRKQKEQRKTRARAFIVVSMGRNGQDRVNRLGIGKCE